MADSMNLQKRIMYELCPPIIIRKLGEYRSRRAHNKLKSRPKGRELIEQKSDDLKGFYMHIHKCAGSSLMQTISTHPQLASITARPGNYYWMCGRDQVPDDIYTACFKFTFVRNPYSRVVSVYRMYRTTMKWRGVFPTFEDLVHFLKWAKLDEQYITKPVEYYQYSKNILTIINHSSTFQNPKYLLSEMDFIGKLENFNEDITKVSELMKIEPSNVPHLNTFGNPYSYRDYYNEETKAIVGEIYKQDIEEFGYEF